MNVGALKIPATRAGFKRLPGIIGVLAVASLLQACSAVKLAYNQAPELTYLYLDGYVDFNGAQSLKVKEELAKVHQWHRQTQLPAYVESLEKFRQHLPGDMDAKVACNAFEDARGKVLTLTSQIEPAAAAVASTLEPRQIRYLEKKFDKTNADYRDDFIEGTPKALREKRLKQTVKRAEMLYGNLDPKQLAVINKRLDTSSFDAKKFYAERLRRQKDAAQTLEPLNGQPVDKAQIAIKKLIERTVASPDRDYRAYAETFTRENCQAFAELHNSTNSEQRRKAVENVKAYEEHFRQLATQPS